MKLTEVLYRRLLHFPSLQEDILWNKKVILHELLQEFGQVVSLKNGLDDMKILVLPIFFQ